MIHQDKTATTYVVTCASQASSTAASATPTFYTDSSGGYDQSYDDDNGCGIYPSALTMTQGPSTIILPYTVDEITATISCKLDGTTSATCTVTQTAVNDHLSTETEPIETLHSITTIALGPADVTFLPVTITAGAAEDEVLASSTDAGTTANPAAGIAKSTGATETGAAASTRGSSNNPAETSKSTSKASPAAAASTGGATIVGAPSALGGSVILVVGLAAAML